MKKFFNSLSLEVQVGLLILLGVLALLVFAWSITDTKPKLDDQCMMRGRTWSCEYQIIEDSPVTHCYCHD